MDQPERHRALARCPVPQKSLSTAPGLGKSSLSCTAPNPQLHGESRQPRLGTWFLRSILLGTDVLGT